MVFRIYDVGGQRSEKRKWLCLFDCVHAVSDLGNLPIKINKIIWSHFDVRFIIPTYFVVEVTVIFAIFDQQPVSLHAILNALDQRVLNDDQAFLRSYDLAPHPPPFPPLPSTTCLSFSVFLCVTARAYCQDTGGGRWAKSRESLALYKSFNTIWDVQFKAFSEGRLLCEPDLVYSEAVRRLQPEQDARGH